MPELLDGATRQSKRGISRFVSANAVPAPPPAVPPRPQGDLTRASIEDIAQAVRTSWPTKSADNRWRRSRGVRDLLQHLNEFPGETWQERWEASGFNEPARPVSVLRSAPRDRSQIGTGAACLFCLRRADHLQHLQLRNPAAGGAEGVLLRHHERRGQRDRRPSYRPARLHHRQRPRQLIRTNGYGSLIHFRLTRPHERTGRPFDQLWARPGTRSEANQEQPAGDEQADLDEQEEDAVVGWVLRLERGPSGRACWPGVFGGGGATRSRRSEPQWRRRSPMGCPALSRWFRAFRR